METKTENKIAIADAIASVQPGRLIGLTYTAKESGEVSRVVIMAGISVSRIYRRALGKLIQLAPSLSGVDAVACAELIDSLNESLTKGIGNNSRYTHKGLKVSHGQTREWNDGKLEIAGYVIRKTVIVPGVHKAVKSSEKTIAKNRLRKVSGLSKFRTYRIDPANISGLRANGRILEFVDYDARIRQWELRREQSEAYRGHKEEC